MGQIILSGDELVCILIANGLLPEEVIDVELAQDEIKLRIKTPWPVFKSLRVGLRFVGFEQGQVVLQLVTNRLIDQFDWLVDKVLAGFPLAEHGARWEYPKLHVDVNPLLRRQVRGAEITNIAFAEGEFRITTNHSLAVNSGDSDSTERQDDKSPRGGDRTDTSDPIEKTGGG